ncbi:MAG TPA: pitrilysin family protein [Pyrinomonadaceae bacterium]|nr:pitrilysin family protein [Pyrinomonadaceae bacterium]
MKFQTGFFKKALWVAVFLAFALIASSPGPLAQTVGEPRRDQLLNGLRVLISNRPGDGLVYLKLRIHSGAAFDLAGKSGTMALLSDALFPDPNTREYFVEDLGGRVEVTSDYDSINVTLSGKAAQFERIVELLSTALISTDLSPEVIGRLREARLKVVRELAVSPALTADRAIAARLFGNYPYGHARMGTQETLARISRPDLMQARERFLNPNNSTLVIIGSVDERRAMRALKQLLGNWRKSDAIVPATFRQPETPDSRTLIIDLPGTETAEARIASRGLARSDKDWAAATLLALVARDLWQTQQPALGKTGFFVRHEAHQLPGMFVMGASVPAAEAANTLAKAREALNTLMKRGATPEMLERARSEAIAEWTKMLERPESMADLWLDADTYQLASFNEPLSQMRAVTNADLIRTANRLFKDTAVVSVAAGPVAKLKADLERTGKVEVLGEAVTPAMASPAPTAPSASAPVKKQ